MRAPESKDSVRADDVLSTGEFWGSPHAVRAASARKPLGVWPTPIYFYRVREAVVNWRFESFRSGRLPAWPPLFEPAAVAR